MNNKNTGIIATIATALICGCCSLFTCMAGFGAVTGTGDSVYAFGNSGDQPLPPAAGVALLCLSMIIILIPIAVGFFTLRKKPGDLVVENEPTPPTAS